MAAITDKFNYASSGTRAEPTTLTAQKAVAATSISCAALNGWPTASAVHFQLYTTDVNNNIVAGSQSDWKGVVSGTTITQLQLQAGTDTVYPIGSIVVALPTAGWADDLADGLLNEHNEDGSHADVTADSVATNTITEDTTGAGVTIDGVQLKDSQIATANAVVTSSIADGAVTFAKTSGIWWEEIGRATASSNTTTLSIASIPNRKYLKIVFNIIPTAAMSSAAVFFNNDTTGSNYGFRSSTNGAADATGVSNGIPVDTGASPGTPAVMFGSIEGVNISTFEKPFFGHSLDTFSTGSSNQPRRREIQGKWANSAVISRVDLTMSVNAAAGTEIIVLGHN